MSVLPENIHQEAIRLRVEERLSLKEISKRLNIAKSSASLWLKGFELTKEEKLLRAVENGKRSASIVRQKTTEIQESKFSKMLLKEDMSSMRKGKISECAVMFRLLLLNFEVYSSVFDGEKIDFVVRKAKENKLYRIQVKTVSINNSISIRCADGRKKAKKYTSKDFDILVGYDVFSDTAFVYTFQELLHLKTYVSAKKESAEAWYKLLRGYSSIGQNTGLSRREVASSNLVTPDLFSQQ